MKIFVAYVNRSCVTGLALRKALRAKRKRSNKRARCNLFIRYGNTEEFTNLTARKELNRLDAVRLAVNKLGSLEALRTANLPVVDFGTDPSTISTFLDRAGNCYIRSKAGVVRYGNDFNTAKDSYYTRPVRFKRREYRVHVFRGRVIGIYEKVPMVEGPENRPKLFKSDTCHFVRCDPANCRVSLDNQASCIAAVAAIGLDFAGVDLIRDKNGNVFICEVNSSPGLNSQMIAKYVEEITRFMNET